MRRRVTEARVATLASVDPSGTLHLVPLCFALDGDSLVSAVDEKPKGSSRLQRFANVRAHPDVALLVHAYHEDWGRLWWVRLRGRARVLEGGPEAERAIALLVEKYAQYRDAPPHAPVLVVDLAEWRGWSAAP
jgi:PPOX class probable F420-dependent enzyme